MNVRPAGRTKIKEDGPEGPSSERSEMQLVRRDYGVSISHSPVE